MWLTFRKGGALPQTAESFDRLYRRGPAVSPRAHGVAWCKSPSVVVALVVRMIGTAFRFKVRGPRDIERLRQCARCTACGHPGRSQHRLRSPLAAGRLAREQHRSRGYRAKM